MFRTLVLGTAFVLSVSFYAAAQEPAAAEKPSENRLEVETADLAQPAGKGITPKKEHKGVVSKKLGKLTKEQREAVKNLDKEYAKLIDILQFRIELLKKEREVKINDLVKTFPKESTTTTPSVSASTQPPAEKTDKEKPKNTRRRIL
ncbi:MAG: hypothetical protein LBB88_05250 [Planctomycetaceae bacterium]|jgi:hypothetical protein|nr:hypothetical protein [Planctomycetaceae bacterium]